MTITTINKRIENQVLVAAKIVLEGAIQIDAYNPDTPLIIIDDVDFADWFETTFGDNTFFIKPQKLGGAFRITVETL